jgi:hypothetical protein
LAPVRSFLFHHLFACVDTTGAWIVTEQWIKSSCEDGEWADASIYEVVDFVPTRATRQRAGPLFDGDRFFIPSNINPPHGVPIPPVGDMEKLVTLAGGTVGMQGPSLSFVLLT